MGFASNGSFDELSSGAVLNSCSYLILESGKINPYFSTVTSEKVEQETIRPLK